MKVAVSSNGNNLDARLDPRFGRCAFFLVINPDDMSFEAFNPKIKKWKTLSNKPAD